MENKGSNPIWWIVFLALGVCQNRSDGRKDNQDDLGKRGDKDGSIRDKGRDEDNRSTAAESSHNASPDSDKPHPEGQQMEPEAKRPLALKPADSTQKSSASARRALFARRRLDASASSRSSTSSPNAPSLIPPREPSPPRSPSPMPPRRTPAAPPSSLLSASSCHVSTSPLRPASPVRGLSPVIVQSHGAGTSGPPGSLADTSACLYPRDRPSTARMVSQKKKKTPWWHGNLFAAFLISSPLIIEASYCFVYFSLCFCRGYN